jgi:alpha-amylase
MHADGGFDRYPENQHGDMYGLKDYNNDDTDQGSELINILIKCHCYWIKETDIDGFRVDALKHMGELACSRFCSNIREYAYSLGKRNFFLFGEAAVASDDIYNRYLGQNTTKQEGEKTIYYGINSLLDFRLAEGVYGDDDNAPLRDVIKGNKGPKTLFNRHAAQQDRALNHGESGKYLVTFIDNHDSFWQPDGRIAATANDLQVIGAIGYLLCSLGTPCIYYGTEQGFEGNGNDEAIRESMFDKNQPGINCLNTKAFIYQEISKIANIMRNNNSLRFGRIYYREISGDGINFGLPFGSSYTLAFSRLIYGQETLIAFNVSDQPRQDYIMIDSSYHKQGEKLTYLYGNNGTVEVLGKPDGSLFVQLLLAEHQFAILM